MLALTTHHPQVMPSSKTFRYKPLSENLSASFPVVIAELGEVIEKQNKLAPSFRGEIAPSTRTRLSERNWRAPSLCMLPLLNKPLAVVVSPYS